MNTDLEQEGITIWRRYKLFIPATVKSFLLKVAIYNQWQKLKKELEP